MVPPRAPGRCMAAPPPSWPHPAFANALTDVPFPAKDIAVALAAVLTFLPLVYAAHHLIAALARLFGKGKRREKRA